MEKEPSAPFTSEKEIEKQLQSLFFDLFAHSLLSCKQLSVLPNDLGKLHEKHLIYFEKLLKIGPENY